MALAPVMCGTPVRLQETTGGTRAPRQQQKPSWTLTDCQKTGQQNSNHRNSDLQKSNQQTNNQQNSNQQRPPYSILHAGAYPVLGLGPCTHLLLGAIFFLSNNLDHLLRSWSHQWHRCSRRLQPVMQVYATLAPWALGHIPKLQCNQSKEACLTMQAQVLMSSQEKIEAIPFGTIKIIYLFTLVASSMWAIKHQAPISDTLERPLMPLSICRVRSKQWDFSMSSCQNSFVLAMLCAWWGTLVIPPMCWCHGPYRGYPPQPPKPHHDMDCKAAPQVPLHHAQVHTFDSNTNRVYMHWYRTAVANNCWFWSLGNWSDFQSHNTKKTKHEHFNLNTHRRLQITHAPVAFCSFRTPSHWVLLIIWWTSQQRASDTKRV